MSLSTEALAMAARDQAFKTRAVTHGIYHTVQYLKCRFCKRHEETMAHMINNCSKLARTKYTEKCSNVASGTSRTTPTSNCFAQGATAPCYGVKLFTYI